MLKALTLGGFQKIEQRKAVNNLLIPLNILAEVFSGFRSETSVCRNALFSKESVRASEWSETLSVDPGSSQQLH